MIGRGRNLSIERNIIQLVVRSREDLRLDQYLLQTLSWKSRSRIQKLIREGVVRVNDETSKPSRRVRVHDEITLELSSGVGMPTDYDERPIDIVYEDDWLLAVNKPPDLLVHPVGRHVYDTLINYLHHRYHEEGDEEQIVPRLCHRIDRDTTGLVVVAKDSYVHKEVMFQFENRLVNKTYLTLVRGIYPEDLKEIDLAIGEGRCLKSALEHEVLKESKTVVQSLESFESCSLLRCKPRTGRQNQIRIHLSASGYPVLGDERFGDCPALEGHPSRHLLHSESLRFYHPRLKSFIRLEAPPPPDFRELLSTLGSRRSFS